MSVFTPVSAREAADWLKHYKLGELVELRGIAAGVENTNYFLTAGRGRFILTLFERLSPTSAAGCLDLMAELAAWGLPCPAPIRNQRGACLGLLNGRPAALVTRLEGLPVEAPEVVHCAAIGAFLGRMHRRTVSLNIRLPNLRGADWHATTAKTLLPYLAPDEQILLAAEMDRQAGRRDQLPRGPTHADLFRDNALFGEAGKLLGVIDFYFAADNNLLFDVAVAVNDWCLAADGVGLDPLRTRALLIAYGAERPLLPAERLAWRDELCAAALRFWLSRCHDQRLPRAGDMVGVKDAEAFRRILIARASDAVPWVD